jgi:hypothetical protein
LPASASPPVASAAAVTLGGALLFAALALLDARMASAKCEVVAGTSPRTRARLDASPALLGVYRPFPGLRNRHVVRALLRVRCTRICGARACRRHAGDGADLPA